jgi:hypothetical protein
VEQKPSESIEIRSASLSIVDDVCVWAVAVVHIPEKTWTMTRKEKPPATV